MDGLGYYLLLRDIGCSRKANTYGFGLLGLSSFRDLSLLRGLPEGFVDAYIDLLVGNLYGGGGGGAGVVEVSSVCSRVLGLLGRLSSFIGGDVFPNVDGIIDSVLDGLRRKSLPEATAYLGDVVNRLSRVVELGSMVREYSQVLVDGLGLDLGVKRYSTIVDLGGVEEFIDFAEKFIGEYKGLYELVCRAIESGVDTGSLRSCLDGAGGDVSDSVRYCIGLYGRRPRIEAVVEAGELYTGVWGKVLVRIVNGERLPVEVTGISISRGFEIGRVEGCRCEGSGKCTATLYVKALEPGIVPCNLGVEGRVIGVGREFRIEVPVELRVSTPHRPLGRVVGRPLVATVESLPGLPSVRSIFSNWLHGLVDYVPGGRSYRVLWRESYTRGWCYGGEVECVRLGCGGWGCSYLCKGVFGEVVIKVPLGFEDIVEEGGEVPTVSSRVMRRIREVADTLMALDHPGIIRLLGYGSKAPVLVYEYANQGTLAYQLDHGWRPGIEDVLIVSLQVADTLRYIHSRGLVHGDIKSGNVFVRDGVVRVGDFSSLTRLLSRTSRRSRLTSCTPGYCAPEQLYIDLKLKAKEYGVENRIDIYQFGNLMLELMGQEPIDGSEILDTDLEEALEDIPVEQLKPLLKKMLSYKPWERPGIEEIEKTIYRIYNNIVSKEQ